MRSGFKIGGYPFIDYDAGGSLDGLLAAQAKVAEMADAQTRMIPGHGPLPNKARLVATHDVPAQLRDRLNAMARAGKTLAEVRAARPNAEADALLGTGLCPAMTSSARRTGPGSATLRDLSNSTIRGVS